MNTALILLNMGCAAIAPAVGWMLDRFPVKRIMVVSTVATGASLVALGLSRSLWLNAFLLSVPLAIGLLGAGTLTMPVLVARWFKAHQGRAMALGSGGMWLGGIVVAPLVGLLIQMEGWRLTLIICGGTVSVLLLTAALFIRERPRHDEIEGEGSASAMETRQMATRGTPRTVGELLRAPGFWTIALSTALALAVAQSIVVSLVPLALSASLTVVEATTLISAISCGAIGGTLILAVIADRLDRVTLLTAIFVLLALLNVALLAGKGYPVLLGIAIALGLVLGTIMPLYYALLVDRFGASSLGTAQGLVAPIIAVIGAVALRFAGDVFDRTGGYGPMFYAFIGVELVAAGIMYSTRFLRGPLQSAAAGCPDRV